MQEENTKPKWKADDTSPILGAEEIFLAYKDMVYRLARLRTRSAADADDVTMDVFVRCLRRQPVWESREHQKAWFIRTTINCTKSLLMSAFYRHTVSEAATPLAEVEKVTEMEEPSEVYEAVLSLPENFRTVIHLFYYEGYAVKEMAKLLDKKESTVKSWLFRARELLRERLKGEESHV